MQERLTADECKLVQASFAQIEPVAHEVAPRFFRRLFELNPDLRPLFKTTGSLPQTRLMETLSIAVIGLDGLDAIAPFVRVLGRKHVEYGVKAEDYDTAREALSWALKEQFGPAFDDDLIAAWDVAFRAVSDVMIEAGAGLGPIDERFGW